MTCQFGRLMVNQVFGISPQDRACSKVYEGVLFNSSPLMTIKHPKALKLKTSFTNRRDMCIVSCFPLFEGRFQLGALAQILAHEFKGPTQGSQFPGNRHYPIPEKIKA